MGLLPKDEKDIIDLHNIVFADDIMFVTKSTAYDTVFFVNL